MPQETKNIIQLKESTSGPNFYPETHKAAIVGKEDYTYLGETVSPGGGGGGSTGGDKPLSVSPRQSVIVGRAIPFHPRKGKKYYFASGVIMVKTNREDGHSLISLYNPEDLINPLASDITPTSHCVPQEYAWGAGRPVLVTIMQESPGDTVFDLSTMARISFPENLNTETESPFFKIVNGHPVLTEVKIPKRSIGALHNLQTEFLIQTTEQQQYWQRRRTCGAILEFSGKIIACEIRRRMHENNHVGIFPQTTYRRNWLASNIKYYKFSMNKLLLQSYRDKKRRVNEGETHIYSVRRCRIGKNYYRVHTSYVIILTHMYNQSKRRANVFKEYREW